LLGKITQEEGFLPSEKDALRKQCEQAPAVDVKTFGLYFLYSTLLEKEIATLKNTFGGELAGALLPFSMMRWGYGSPIKRAGSYHAHDFISEELFANALSDKCITHTLRAAGENREKVVAWMKSLLEELPEEGKNFCDDGLHSYPESF
jgi:hypothetical protein